MPVRDSAVNPLRWYLLALLSGFVLSLFVDDPYEKFQLQRIAQLIPALGILAWSYRGQASYSLLRPAASAVYGLGLIAFFVVSLVAGSLGPIPWISLGFMGLVLFQFSLFPLLRPAWSKHGSDSVRVLALFAIAILGIDATLLIVSSMAGFKPYALNVRFLDGGGVDAFPYLFLNSRWANQASLLLVWSFMPLLFQLYFRRICTRQVFWWAVCLLIPVLAMAQIVLSGGRGAILTVLVVILSVFLWACRLDGGRQRFLFLSGLVLSLSLVAAFGLSILLDNGNVLAEAVSRSAREFAPAVEGQSKRTVLWQAFALGAWRDGLSGQGVPFVAPGAPSCTPHNLWLSLLYWTGLLGVLFAPLLAVDFVPKRFAFSGLQVVALPILVTLLIYPMVDDLWVRVMPLALLLIILPGLKPLKISSRVPVGSRRWLWLQSFAFPAVVYRSMALLGVLLVCISLLHPQGIGDGPSSLVSIPGRTCMLFF